MSIAKVKLEFRDRPTQVYEVDSTKHNLIVERNSVWVDVFKRKIIWKRKAFSNVEYQDVNAQKQVLACFKAELVTAIICEQNVNE